MSTSYDVIINGAGMVGAVTALMLAGQGNQDTGGEAFKVAVIEHGEQTTFDPAGEHQMRVSAISAHNLALLSELGLDRYWTESRMGFYQHMRVWDNQSTGELDFAASTQQPLGAMVENNQLIAAAQQLISTHPDIDVFYQQQIDSIECNERSVRLVLKDQQPLQAKLLVGADGARSMVRQSMGIEWIQKPYEQKGLVCYLKMSDAPEKTALQAFNSGGPVGLLPMNDGLFSMVWSLPDDDVDRWLQADEQTFINALKVHINRDLGDIELASERAAFPLYQSQAKTYVKDRVVLVGDAAHTIHPLAGQGGNLGFADAECLATKLKGVRLRDAEALARALKKYQRVRKAEVNKTAATMDALHHLFTHPSPALKPLRAFGMNRLNQLAPLKHWLLKQAGS